MPSHFSTIGFDVATKEDFAALAHQLAGLAERIPTKEGEYRRWAGKSGEEVWLQIEAGKLVGMNPHFSGRSRLRVGVMGRVRRENDTALDGAFHVWADPEGDAPESGAYPFVFDVPNAGTYSELRVPAVAEAQIAAFAHEITFYESAEAYEASQRNMEVRFASQSFIPSGLFTPEGTDTSPPEAFAMFTGHVIEADIRRNSMTETPYYWALVDTLGGRYDVVIDRNLLPEGPTTGGILSGTFWCSGRLTSYPRVEKSWSGKLFGGGS